MATRQHDHHRVVVLQWDLTEGRCVRLKLVNGGTPVHLLTPVAVVARSRRAASRLTALPTTEFPEALVRQFATTWRNPEAATRGQLRRLFSDIDHGALARAHSDTLVVPRMAAAFDVPETNIAAALALVIGLVIGDSLIRLDGLARASPRRNGSPSRHR
jgi:hypothetical protein